MILFHAGFDLFAGGFVGVDIFFVISGYLITTLLIEDIENGSFSILRFYERRARRILPALFFVCLTCIPFAWMWMLPEQLKDFSQSLIAVSLFASNILFWRESGYFSEAAENKPLLHTWSLAVEEQYYILFPIFLILAWRLGKRPVFWIIVVLSAASLALSEWGWRNAPTANFYLAPTRAWELFAGSITAFLIRRNGTVQNEMLAMLGLALILISIFAYDATIPFPSLYTLVPVVGVALIILYGDGRTMVGRLLGLKGLVALGLVSYSAYLWHQPLFAFARIGLLEHPGWPLMLALSAASIGLAVVSWRFVEQPFRRRTPISAASVKVVGVSAVSLATVAVAGTILWTTVPENDLLRETNGGACNYNGKRCFEIEEADLKVALWGDSYADAFSTSLGRQLNGKGISLALFIRHSCPSLTGTLRNEDVRLGEAFKEDCLEHTQASLNEILTGAYDVVVLNSAYEWYATATNEQDEPIIMPLGPDEISTGSQVQFLADRLSDTIATLQNAGRRVIVLTPHPGVSEEQFLTYRKMRHRGIQGEFLADYQTAERVRDAIVETIADRGLDAVEVNGLDLFCGGERCSILNADREFLLFDGYHISSIVAPEVARRIANAIGPFGTEPLRGNRLNQIRSAPPLASQ